MQLFNRDYSFLILQEAPEAFCQAFEICFGEPLQPEAVGTPELQAWLHENIRDNESYLLFLAYVRMADFELKTGIKLDSPVFLHNDNIHLPTTPEALKNAGQGVARTQSRWMNAAFRSDCRNKLRALMFASQEEREEMIKELEYQDEKWLMIVAFIAYAHDASWDELTQTAIAYYFAHMAPFERGVGNPEMPPDRRVMTNTSLHSLKMYIAADELEQIAVNLAEEHFPHDGALQLRIKERCQILKEWYIWHDASDFEGEAAIGYAVSEPAIRQAMEKMTAAERALVNPEAVHFNLSVSGNWNYVSTDKNVTAKIKAEYDALVKIREHEMFERGVANTLEKMRRNMGDVVSEQDLAKLEAHIRSVFTAMENDTGIMHARLKLFDHMQTTYDILNANRNGQDATKYTEAEREQMGLLLWNSITNGMTAFKIDYVMKYFLETREFALQSNDPVDWILDAATAQLVEQHYRTIMPFLPEKFIVEQKYLNSVLVTETDEAGRKYSHSAVFPLLLRAVLGGHINAVNHETDAENPLRALETSPLRVHMGAAR